MDEREIFDLIVRADERRKYAHGAGGAAARDAAIALLREARAAALERGNDALLTQIDTRLAELGAQG